MHIVIQLEGVLRGQFDEPIPQGIILTGQLSAYNQITFITDLSEAQAQQWINVNKVVDYDNLITNSVALVGEELAPRQLKHARSKGHIDLVITNSPTLWAQAFEMGIPSIMFGVPSYTRTEFRPDAPKKVRAWTDIEDAIRKQNELRTQDARLGQGEGVRFE